MASRKEPLPSTKTETPTERKVDLWTKARPVSELDEFDFIKALIYGPNGTMKTAIGSRFKKPFIGCTEMQGIPTIRRNNPDAVIYHDEDGVPGIRSTSDIQNFFAMADSAAAHGCDAVVLDGITDVQRIIRNYYTGRQGGKAGKLKTSQETWGIILDQTIRVCVRMRDLRGVHTVVTCLSREVETLDGPVYRPSVSGKSLPNEMGQFFNLVGYSHRRGFEKGVRYQVLFEGDDAYSTKGMVGIGSIEPPEPLLWVAKIKGLDVPKEVEERTEAWKTLGETNVYDDEDSNDE